MGLKPPYVCLYQPPETPCLTLLSLVWNPRYHPSKPNTIPPPPGLYNPAIIPDSVPKFQHRTRPQAPSTAIRTSCKAQAPGGQGGHVCLILILITSHESRFLGNSEHQTLLQQFRLDFRHRELPRFAKVRTVLLVLGKFQGLTEIWYYCTMHSSTRFTPLRRVGES